MELQDQVEMFGRLLENLRNTPREKVKWCAREIIAKRCGVSETAVFSWEKGSTIPLGYRLCRIAKAYRVADADVTVFFSTWGTSTQAHKKIKNLRKPFKQCRGPNPDCDVYLAGYTNARRHSSISRH